MTMTQIFALVAGFRFLQLIGGIAMKMAAWGCLTEVWKISASAYPTMEQLLASSSAFLSSSLGYQ